MNYDYLKTKKEKIMLMKQEIEALERKKEQLKELEISYYYDFFKLNRKDFSLLTDIPNNYTNEKHILCDYSILNVDTIGKIICQLLKKYEGINAISKRLYISDTLDDIFHSRVSYPILVIGKSDEVYELNSCDKNIVIEYASNVTLYEYPSNNPVLWYMASSSGPYERSNYRKLIGYYDDLNFDYKQYEFIKDLIFSLSYYQKQHDIKQLGARDTWNVYQKIYSKKIMK